MHPYRARIDPMETPAVPRLSPDRIVPLLALVVCAPAVALTIVRGLTFDVVSTLALLVTLGSIKSLLVRKS